tara:strand:+ start:70 stop:228 length:159 start_codon:yes stop_codon:yes gene_type:complete
MALNDTEKELVIQWLSDYPQGVDSELWGYGGAAACDNLIATDMNEKELSEYG